MLVRKLGDRIVNDEIINRDSPGAKPGSVKPFHLRSCNYQLSKLDTSFARDAGVNVMSDSILLKPAALKADIV